MICFFAADLHGHERRYQRLVEAATVERPAAIFLGGDLLPHAGACRVGCGHFIGDYLQPLFLDLRALLGVNAPRVFVIFGNDDPRCEEPALMAGERAGAWTYVHERHLTWEGLDVYGYACVPPSPFLLKDWERYDVSRHLDPGAVSPEEGRRTVAVPAHETRYGTIQRDLDALTRAADMTRAILLFHAPPHDTVLDRAALDGRTVDHVPLDLHVGSIAVRRFIEARQPLLTLHGHVHESPRLTGAWQQWLGRTLSVSAAHDGPELALVRFDPHALAHVTRELIGCD